MAVRTRAKLHRLLSKGEISKGKNSASTMKIFLDIRWWIDLRNNFFFIEFKKSVRDLYIFGKDNNILCLYNLSDVTNVRNVISERKSRSKKKKSSGRTNICYRISWKERWIKPGCVWYHVYILVRNFQWLTIFPRYIHTPLIISIQRDYHNYERNSRNSLLQLYSPIFWLTLSRRL